MPETPRTRRLRNDLRTLERLREEAAQGRREDQERFLAAVPDVPPAHTDRLAGANGG